MNVYMFEDKSITAGFARAAERLGFQAVVVTVDAPFHHGSAAGDGDPLTPYPPAEMEQVLQSLPNLVLPEVNHYFQQYTKGQEDAPNLGSVTWEKIDWLKGQTNLPIILKGVMNIHDAKMAAAHGIRGIIVSNHGGR